MCGPREETIDEEREALVYEILCADCKDKATKKQIESGAIIFDVPAEEYGFCASCIKELANRQYFDIGANAWNATIFG